MKAAKLNFCRQLEMPRYYMLKRQRENMLQRRNPVLHVALIHRRAGVGQKQISRGDCLLVREINHQITHRVCRTRMIDLHAVSSNEKRQGAMHRQILRVNRLDMLSRVERADHRGILPEHAVPSPMVRVIMRVYNPAHRRSRDLADLGLKLPSFHLIQSGIHHQNAGIADQKS